LIRQPTANAALPGGDTTGEADPALAWHGAEQDAFSLSR